MNRLLTLTSQLVKDSLITAAIVLEPLYKFFGIHFTSNTSAGTCTVNEARQVKPQMYTGVLYLWYNTIYRPISTHNTGQLTNTDLAVVRVKTGRKQSLSSSRHCRRLTRTAVSQWQISVAPASRQCCAAEDNVTVSIMALVKYLPCNLTFCNYIVHIGDFPGNVPIWDSPMNYNSNKHCYVIRDYFRNNTYMELT